MDKKPTENETAENKCWREVRKRLQLLYGKTPPPEFVSRLDAEEALLKHSGLIEHYSFIGALARKGVGDENANPFSVNPLCAWLLDASVINPLPPHTVCPRCRKTVLHPKVKDGWDIPPGRCECGNELYRDGHDIGPEALEYDIAQRRYHPTVNVYCDELDTIRETMEQCYGGRWRLCKYTSLTWRRANRKFAETSNGLCVIVPAGTKTTHGKGEGWDGLPLCRLRDAEAAREPFMFVSVHRATNVACDESQRKLPFLPLDSLISEENLNDTWNDDHTIRIMNEKWRDAITGKNGMAPNTVPRFRRQDDLSKYVSGNPSIDDMVRFRGWNMFAYVWEEGVRGSLESGRASFTEIPGNREDLFEYILKKAAAAGVDIRGTAVKLLGELQSFEVPEPEMLETLRRAGCEDWLIDYINAAAKNGFIPSKERVIASVYEFLYRTRMRKYFAERGEEYKLSYGDAYRNAKTEKCCITDYILEHDANSTDNQEQ